MVPISTNSFCAKFHGLYNCGTLQDAVEEAAWTERDNSLFGYSDYYKIPVNLDIIAKNKGILCCKKLPESDHRDAILIPQKNGFLIEMSPNGIIGKQNICVGKRSQE